ncbi:MAG: MBL fold metallo-hydrolase [Polyangia bacterium]|nr:MBL fold metallo-hydrolase [Polyangia bacterium]
MELLPILPGIFLLPGANGGSFPFSNSVLVDSDTVCLIDAGCGLAQLEAGLEIATPDLILITHAHPDHISGCWMFDDVPLHVPAMSRADVGDLDRMARRFAPSHLQQPYKSYIQGSMGFEACSPTHTYEAGASFDFGQARLVAIHAPGHTEDHMCFFDTTSGLLISGDIDLTLFGPWYGDMESDIEELKKSVQSVMDLEPRVVVSGHGGVFRTDLQGRFQRYLDVISMRHGAIAELVRKERTLDELVSLSPIYRERPLAPELTAWWERQMIRKHLELLILEGRVQHTGKGYISRR